MSAMRLARTLGAGIVFFGLACASGFGIQRPEGPASNPPAAGKAKTGLAVRTLVGPMCPGPVRPDRTCPDKPISVGVLILDSSGKTVATPQTDEQGFCELALPPGRYVVTAGASVPRMLRLRTPSVAVTVSEGEVTTVELHFDSGMR